MNNIFSHRWAIPFFFLLILLIRFWPFLIGKTIFFGDTYVLFVPGKLVIAQMLRQGTLPFWNPYVLSGISILGDINQSLFSFSTVLFTVLEAALAVNLTVLLHHAIGFFGMYALVRTTARKSVAILSGMLFIFSGYFSNTVGNLSILQSVSFVPWVLVFAGDRSWRRFWKASLFLALLLMGGYPQLLLYVIVLGVVLFPSASLRSTCMRWAGIVALSILLASAAIIPFVPTLLSSTRVLQTSSQAISGSLHPMDLLSLVFPRLFIDAQVGLKWGPQWNVMGSQTLFIPWIFSVFTVLLFWQKRLTRVQKKLLILLIGSLVLSLGEYVPFLSELLSLPMVRFLRGPSHGVVVFATCVSLFCASILEQLFKQDVDTKKLLRYSIVVFLVATVVSFLVVSSFDRLWNIVDTISGSRISGSQFHTLQKDEVIVRHMVRILLVHLGLFTLSLYAWREKRIVLFVMFLAVQMHLATSSFLFFAPIDIYPTRAQIREKTAEYKHILGEETVLISNGNLPYTDFFSYFENLAVRQPFSDSYVDAKELDSFTHLMRMRDTLTPNWNAVYSVRSMTGYVSLLPQHIDAKWRTGSQPLINALPTIDPRSEKLKEDQIKFAVVDHFFPQSQIYLNFETVRGIGPATIYKLP